MSSSLAPIPTDLLRDRLLAVADLLGVHPAGAVMERLLDTSGAVLRRVVAEEPVDLPAADHLALLALFAAGVRGRLSDPDPRVTARRLVAWRRWLRTPSLPGPDGPIRPLDRLGDPEGAAEAVHDLLGAPVERRHGPVAVRLVSLVRPGPHPSAAG
jgi:hypothetical protein